MADKILVVEDNELNRKLIVAVLTHYGYETLEAWDGSEGIKSAVEYMPDLILLDIQMPVMDGITAVKILRSEPKTKAIKMIALTSFAVKSEREKVMEAGFDDYISKPINTRDLPEVVKRMLSPVVK